MAISDDFWLIDSETGTFYGADTSVLAPQVYGGLMHDVYADPEAAVEYGETYGTPLEDAGVGVAIDAISGDRDYIVIDLENGNITEPGSLRLVPAGDADDYPFADEAIALSEGGEAPSVPESAFEVDDPPFESVTE